MAGEVFKKQVTLKPSTMVTVSDRRFADALALLNTGKNRHLNGAVYLAGFVIEILLKARLVEKHPSIARKKAHRLTEHDRPVWSLIWRSHDLEAMLMALPDLEASLKKTGERDHGHI